MQPSHGLYGYVSLLEGSNIMLGPLVFLFSAGKTEWIYIYIWFDLNSLNESAKVDGAFGVVGEMIQVDSYFAK